MTRSDFHMDGVPATLPTDVIDRICDAVLAKLAKK